MAKVQLVNLAHARSGDKGNTVNVGVIAYEAEDYPLLVEALTVERVKAHFGDAVRGEVERFELPNLNALNFLLHDALGGGGTVSLMTDAQGKVFSTALLRMEVDVPDEVARRAKGRGRAPPDFDPRRPVSGATPSESAGGSKGSRASLRSSASLRSDASGRSNEATP